MFSAQHFWMSNHAQVGALQNIFLTLKLTICVIMKLLVTMNPNCYYNTFFSTKLGWILCYQGR